MLAELAAANAAFSIIKQTVQNTGDFTNAISQIKTFVGSKADLEKKLEKKRGGGLFSSPADDNDLEEFIALEKIRENEAELKQWMIYAGRAGLWTDWQAFQAEARKKRKEEAAELAKRREDAIHKILIGALVATILSCLIGLFYWVMWLAS